MKKKILSQITIAVIAIVMILGIVVAIPIIKEYQLNKKVQGIVDSLSTDEKIGQVLLMDFRSWGKDMNGLEMPLEKCHDTIKEIIQKYSLSNVILFGENVQDTEKGVRFIDDLQKASLSSGGMPLLIGIDQEGGVVTRLGQGTCLPGNMALGATGKKENAALAADVIGEELAAIGVNCNFAPNCDVNDNPQNPVIHLRSFSSDPSIVSEMAISYRKGLKENRIIAVAKHFPGHGNTTVDTHVGLAVVDKTKKEWEEVEAVPFKAMIQDGLDMIMTAHIQYPQLDDTRYQSKLTGEKLYLPATLSHEILTNILRDEMKFDGVIVTDAMTMTAITENFGETEASVMALAAGADLLCTPTNVTSIEEIVNLENLYAEINLALTDGRLSMERLNESAGRVIRLKMSYGILDKAQYEIGVEEKVENALKVVGSQAHRDTERKLANEAITYYAEQPYAPMKLAEDETILFLVPHADKGYSVRYAMNRLFKENKIPKVNTQILSYRKEVNITKELTEKISLADHVVIVSSMSASSLRNPESMEVKMPILLAETVKKYKKEKVSGVISTGLPNDIYNFPGLPVYLAYNYQGMSQIDIDSDVITAKYGPNLPSAIDCLMGVFQPTGTLPVKLSQ